MTTKRAPEGQETLMEVQADIHKRGRRAQSRCGFEEENRFPEREDDIGIFAVPRSDGAGRCPPGPRNECAGGRTKAAAKRVASFQSRWAHCHGSLVVKELASAEANASNGLILLRPSHRKQALRVLQRHGAAVDDGRRAAGAQRQALRAFRLDRDLHRSLVALQAPSGRLCGAWLARAPGGPARGRAAGAQRQALRGTTVPLPAHVLCRRAAGRPAAGFAGPPGPGGAPECVESRCRRPAAGFEDLRQRRAIPRPHKKVLQGRSRCRRPAAGVILTSTLMFAAGIATAARASTSGAQDHRAATAAVTDCGSRRRAAATLGRIVALQTPSGRLCSAPSLPASRCRRPAVGVAGPTRAIRSLSRAAGAQRQALREARMRVTLTKEESRCRRPAAGFAGMRTCLTSSLVTAVALQAPSGRLCGARSATTWASSRRPDLSRCRRPAAGFAGVFRSGAWCWPGFRIRPAPGAWSRR